MHINLVNLIILLLPTTFAQLTQTIPDLTRISSPSNFIKALPTCSQACALSYFASSGCPSSDDISSGWSCYCESKGGRKDAHNKWLECVQEDCKVVGSQGSDLITAVLSFQQVKAVCWGK
jgi:hypothetical protein